MNRKQISLSLTSLAIASAFGLMGIVPSFAIAQGYHIERIASGLNQPSYVTQAPGDPANILYYTTRTRDANPGFGANNQMGSVWRYDVVTRTSTQVLDLDFRFVTQDTGLTNIAFHPDFNSVGTDGYGKMYVSSAEANSPPTNRVEEYLVDIDGPTPSYAARFNRLILEYENNASVNNHTLNWVGFDPTATGDDRNYLYISTGDGAFGLPYESGGVLQRPSQDPTDVAGKILRVDVIGADAYLGDANKNFAIPSSNPIPVYNANNPGNEINGVGEVWLTGIRNSSRISFDRQTGDLWMGDVGETAREEVNFLKAGTNTNGPPVDYGWPQREGTIESDISGAPNSTVNPFTGVTALEPVQEFPHDGGGEAVIGGYLYRGAASALQGKYFYTDFVTIGNAAQFWMLDFDRDTDPANYNGNNGTNTDVSAVWQSLVYDPTDPSYLPDSSDQDPDGLDHIVSFGEDNAGNMYIVDFGTGALFQGQYPGPGQGEIFRIVPDLPVTITVDRDTGEMTFSNDTGVMTGIRGYTLSSAAGAIDPDELSPITDRLDAMPNGDGSIDPNNFWQITSAPGDHEQFSEESTGTAATLGVDEQFALSPADGWIQSIYEDLGLFVVLDNGSEVFASVEYVGNSGSPFPRSDLNFNGMLDPGDWPFLRDNHLTDLSGMSIAQSYQLGDLDGDGDNDFNDFRLFQGDYIAALGAAAFAQLFAVPEPSSAALVVTLAALAGAFSRRRRRTGPSSRDPFDGRRVVSWLAPIAAVASLGLLSSVARADLVHQYTFNDANVVDLISGADGTVFGNVTFSTGTANFPGGTDDYIDLPGPTIAINDFTDGSFEAWFTYNGGPNWQRVFDFGSTFFNGEGRDYVFFTPNSSQGEARAAISNNNFTAEDVVVAGPTLNTDQLYHVVVVVDNNVNGGSDEMTVYLDGQFAGSVGLVHDFADLDNDNAYLGNSNYTSDASLDGTIEEFRIYNHALSAQEVEDSFDAGFVRIASLELEVNTVTGSVTLKNENMSPMSFDYYRVTSAGGALDSDGWMSFDEQELDKIGDAEGESWDELGQPNAGELIEGYLLGASEVGAGASLPLGHMFDTSVFGQGQQGDLEFQFAPQGDNLTTGDVTYVTPGPLDGDYNQNGTVDAADYTVWRDARGTTLAAADGDGDGIVDDDDYVIWVWNFGNTAGGAGSLASGTAVPEPTSGALCVLALLWRAPRHRSLRRWSP